MSIILANFGKYAISDCPFISMFITVTTKVIYIVGLLCQRLANLTKSNYTVSLKHVFLFYSPAQRSCLGGGVLEHLVRPSVCRRHGFRSVTHVRFGISISNFICMLFVAMGLFIFVDVSFKMAAWQPYWTFRFPDSTGITCISGKKHIDFPHCHFQNGRLVAILAFSVSGL